MELLQNGNGNVLQLSNELYREPKVYAVQCSVEDKDSSLYFNLDDDCYEHLILTGNRNYNSHTTIEYDNFIKYVDDAGVAITDEVEFEAKKDNGLLEEGEEFEWDTFKDVLSYIYTNRQRFEALTDEEIEKWKLIVSSYEQASKRDKDEIICNALSLLTGHPYEYRYIRGCCQGDWQGCYYATDLYSDEAIDEIEGLYFNTGTEWQVTEPTKEYIKCAEDIQNVETCGMYLVNEWKEEDIKERIAREQGVKPEDVILFIIENEKYYNGTRVTYKAV